VLTGLMRISGRVRVCNWYTAPGSVACSARRAGGACVIGPVRWPGGHERGAVCRIRRTGVAYGRYNRIGRREYGVPEEALPWWERNDSV